MVAEQPDALIGALLDVVGPDGTLVVYTSWDSVQDAVVRWVNLATWLP